MLIKIIFFPLLLLPSVFFAQNKIDEINFDISNFKSEALSIMNKLGIKKRINISKDDTLKIFVDTSLRFFDAKFGTLKKKGVMSPKDIRLRYYITPAIKVSPLMKLVITKLKDTTSLAKLKAYSIIIHEIAHYLQETWDNDNYFVFETMQDEKLYISQPSELEAYSVGAYYYLSFNQKKTLTKIMSSDIIQETKYKMLINAYRESVYPWRKKLFE